MYTYDFCITDSICFTIMYRARSLSPDHSKSVIRRRSLSRIREHSAHVNLESAKKQVTNLDFKHSLFALTTMV